MSRAPTNPAKVTSPSVGEVITLGRFALILAVLVLAWFPDVVTGARSFFTRDFSSFGYPLAWETAQSYRAGEIPLWNPYNFCGLPFLAQWNTMTLYPWSAFYVLLPLPWSLNVFNLLHLYLGGLGAFCLARAWIKDGRAAAVAGIGYACGGMMVSALMWPNNIAALGCLPWVWLAGEHGAARGRRAWIIGVLALALQFLTGAPEIIALTWAGLGALVLFGERVDAMSLARRGALLMAAFIGALALCAIQLLPFLELLRQSQRDSGYSSANWSLTWAGLGNLLVPLFHCVQDRDGVYFQASQQWVTSYYPGATIVLLAVLGVWRVKERRVRLLAIGAALSVALALGPYAGLYDALRKIFPPLGVMRYPIKFIVPLAVILPLLAGYGARAWLAGFAPRRATERLFLALAVVMLALALSQRIWPVQDSDIAAVAIGAAASLACAGALFAAVTWSGWSRLPEGRWLQPAAILAVVFLDLLAANRPINPVVAEQLMRINYASIEPKPVLGHARLMVSPGAHRKLDQTMFTTPEAAAQIPRYAQVLNLNLPDANPKLDGFFSLYLPASMEVSRRLAMTTGPLPVGLLDFLGVSHTNRASLPSAWDRRAGELPLATLVPEAVFLEPATALDHLFSPEFNPRGHVVLPADLRGKTGVTNHAAGRIASAAYGAQGHRFTIETDGAMFLVLAQTDAPGWQARMDGQPVAIWRANSAYQALVVPAGRHDVELHYRPQSFQRGMMVSAAALVGLVAIGVLSRRRSAAAD